MKKKKRFVSFILAIGCFIACSGFSSQSYAANFTITVDAKTSWGTLPHFWSQCHAVGRLGLVGRDTLQRHIQDAMTNLGVKMIRCHAGVSDAMIYSETAGGTPVYSWTLSDSLYDIFVRKLHVKPFVELDWIPSALQTTGYSICPGPYCPPKDYTKWKNFIYEFVNHYKQRYGAAEIERWRFETWNEAEWFGNYGNPGPPPLSENYKIQANSTWGALLADSNIMIGGPATSGYDWEKSQSGPYLNYAGQNNVRVDFLSYHAYHEFWKTVDGHFMALDTMAAYNAKYPKLHCIESDNTEYGPTWQFNLDPEPAETEYGATFVADMMSQIARRCHTDNRPFPFMYDWWVLSDVFDEATYRAQYPFIGCMGYISRQDIYKPAYNVFKMMNRLGSNFTSIATNPATGTVNGLAAMDANNGVQVLVYNADYANSGTDNVTVMVNNITSSSGKVNYRSYLMDKTHSNSYQTWKTMGSPTIAAMSAANWNSLRAAMVLARIDSTDSMQLTNNSFSKAYTLSKEGVMLIMLTPSDAPTVIRPESAENRPAFNIVTSKSGSKVIVSYTLKQGALVDLAVFNATGRIVKKLGKGHQNAGTHLVSFDVDKLGVNCGVYFLNCRAGKNVRIYTFTKAY